MLQSLNRRRLTVFRLICTATVLWWGQLAVLPAQPAPEASVLPAAASRSTHLKWAETPPMGWNSWDAFATTVTEKQIKAEADVMAAKLKHYGWQYVVVDIQWYEPNADSFNYRAGAKLSMDPWGRLQPATNKFPSAAQGKGFRPLADYVHSKGLKFGIHMMRGIPRQAVERNTPIKGTRFHAADIADTNSICPWNPDMYGVDMSKPGAQAYYDTIFEQAAGWGLDFVKVDDLSRPYHLAEIEAIRKAIDKTGRPIVFSTSPGATPLAMGPHIMRNANMWRISDDFWDDWSALFKQFKRLNDWTPYRGSGHYPDADMLPLGAIRQVPGYRGGPRTRLTQDEQMTMMTLWSMARSPLMMGGDLTKLDDWTLSLLTNAEVLAVDQHSSHNRQLFKHDGFVAWIADVPDSTDKYLGLFNTQNARSVDENRAAFQSKPVTRRTTGHGVSLDVNIAGARKLYLVVDDGGDNSRADHADWVRPCLTGPKGELKLTDLKWVKAAAGWGRVFVNRTAGGRTMSVNGQSVADGIGTHAPSVIEYDLPEGYGRFKAFGALDDVGTKQPKVKGATVRFLVFTRSPYAEADNRIAVPIAELGFQGSVTVRDLWQHQDLGRFRNIFAAEIPAHGAGLYRVAGE